MRHQPSLALRLTLLFGAAAAIIFPLFGWVIDQSIDRHFEAGDIAELKVIAHTVEEGLAGTRSAADFTALEERFDDILVGHHGAAMFILDANRQPIYTSPGSDLPTRLGISVSGTPTNGDTVNRWSDGQRNYRVLIRHVRGVGPLTGRPYTLGIAVQIDYHLEFLAHFHRTLWLVIAASIVIMTLMGWIAVQQGHAPLRRIVTRIRRISASELNTRLEPDSVPGELTDLALSFNAMLQRVDKAFRRLSDFNADIAHELRTPITNLMTQTQVALSRTRSVDAYREILYSNMEEYERMAQMVGDMLFLAQAERSPENKQLTELDLAGEIRALFDYYESWAEEHGVTLALRGAATTTGDHSMLQRALGNLLSNAVRHTAAGETVRVEIDGTPDGVRIAIENPGPDIPPEHLPKLFDRFYRIDPSRTRNGSGAGLGLAIAKSIVEAHGGTIGVISMAGRTRFTIVLPDRSTPV